MAAYAALVSVMHIIEQIQHHPRPPISLDENQVQWLVEKVTFLQDFLEVYSHVRNEEVDRLQSLIADAAYAAEDVIETHIVDQIHAQSSSQGKSITSVDFYQDLQNVIQDMDSIKKEVMEMKEKMGSLKDIQRHTRSSMPPAGSSRSLSEGKNTMVGFDDISNQLMDKLTAQNSNLQIIPVVGMGGIGKTTLVRHFYENSRTVHHFDLHAWATISQEFSVKEILLDLLCQGKEDRESSSQKREDEYRQRKEYRESLSQKREDELGVILYQRLWSRRYLIVMDDKWSVEAWDKIKSFFPNDNNGSRIIITTRLSNVALYFTGGHSDRGLEMSFLNNDISWSLLCRIAFGEDGCPLELEEIGKKIAKNCKGLPLSIVVIGGLLAKSERSPQYWEYIAQNLNSIVNLDDKERCLNLLRMSYDHLPVHLKPCFLYMGIFGEDSMIDVKQLIVLWVAEGFLKPLSGKSLEEVAEEYLEDLIDRNLILAYRRDYNGKKISCKIHDLLRDLCLREAEKDKFLLVIELNSLTNFAQEINTQRRVVLRQGTSKEESEHYLPQIRDALQSATLIRSLICNSPKLLPSPNCRLLRLLFVWDEHSESLQKYPLEAFIVQLVNLRCILVGCIFEWEPIESQFSSSACPFWNLQSLYTITKSVGIWKMPLLRHVGIKKWHLPDPSRNDFVLENLQNLVVTDHTTCSKEIVKRIPNIKKLWIHYAEEFVGSCHCLTNLAHFHKLEKLTLNFRGPQETLNGIDWVQNLVFPHSLKELDLYGCRFPLEEIATKIGSLPFLQSLYCSCMGSEWVTVEGQFCSLKSLTIVDSDLECWTTDNTHFPCLEHLVLQGLHQLKEIPLEIGEITTLQSIELANCSFSSVISAKKMVEEQEENGNEDLQVRVILLEKNAEIESWGSHNFLVQVPRVEMFSLKKTPNRGMVKKMIVEHLLSSILSSGLQQIKKKIG